MPPKTSENLRRQARMIEASAENDPDHTGDSLSAAYREADRLEAEADALDRAEVSE